MTSLSLSNKILFRLIRFYVELTIKSLNFLYPIDKLNYGRFYVLENIARIPYFSYLCVLHLYQTFDRPVSLDLMNLHFKESMNETYHLAIAKELGGNKLIQDRILSRIVGFFYYPLNIALYFISPKGGYYLMELVEKEAVHSYSVLLERFGEQLQTQKAGPIAHSYYFDPRCRMVNEEDNSYSHNQDSVTLFDIFTAIKIDEEIHVQNMQENQ